MGEGISRIEREFIIRSLSDNKIPLRIHCNKIQRSGIITDYNLKDIVLETKIEDLDKFLNEDIRVFFSYYGHVMTFETTIKTINSKNIILKYPDSIYKKLTRKYERIKNPKGISISFDFKATKYELSFPKAEVYSDLDKNALSDDFDYNNIENLMKQFREKSLQFCTDAKIIMLRNKQPSSFTEELITKKGKMIYIEDIDKGLPEIDETSEGLVITKRMILKNQDDSISDLFIEEELEAYIEEKRDAGIKSELYCPILYQDYVLGYIYMYLNKTEKEKAFSIDLVEFVYQFSKIIAYSLKINGYFKDKLIGSEAYKGEIIDISASGILFSHNSPVIDETLSLYNDLNLFLEIGKRKLKIKSRVMRKYKEESVAYFGLLFLDIAPEDFRFLFDYIYGRAFTLNDKEKWEGGAAPPDLESF